MIKIGIQQKKIENESKTFNYTVSIKNPTLLSLIMVKRFLYNYENKDWLK